MNKKSTGILIAAAGNSSRMGTCKFLLKTASGITFLESILLACKDFGFGKTVVVISSANLNRVRKACSSEILRGVEFVINPHPERERFYSIQLGVQALKNFKHVFIHNADNPELYAALIDDLWHERKKASVIIPEYKGKGGHPILIDEKVIQHIPEYHYEFRLNMVLKFFPAFRMKTGHEEILLDIDTEQDYENYLQKELLVVHDAVL